MMQTWIDALVGCACTEGADAARAAPPPDTNPPSCCEPPASSGWIHSAMLGGMLLVGAGLAVLSCLP